MPRSSSGKIVIFNQAANYLTVGLANEFAKQFDEVTLMTGNVHAQGEELDQRITIDPISRWQEEHGIGKAIIYLKALTSIYFKLLFKYRAYEVFFISVPPMGYLLNLILPHRFSMLIWDVYPDILKITGMKESHPVYQIWSKLNTMSFKKAYKLFTISDGMAEVLSKYADKNEIIIEPLWSIFTGDERVVRDDNIFVKKHNLKNKFVVQYSGNIGLTHNVEFIIALAERMKHNSDILFQIIGRGPRKHYLENLVKEKNLINCQFLPFQSDDMFPYSLSAADLGVVILDERTSNGSVPSKSYNLMSFGIPSLYIAAEDSELAAYAKKYRHAECYSENELEKAKDFILKLSLNHDYREELSSNSLKAATNFKRKNAERFVNAYCESDRI